MRLLLIEDDDILGEGLRDFLRAEGHTVDWCRCLADTGARRGEPFDAWLVDWQLPDGSGLDWLRGQRVRGDNTPALMLTARDRLPDRVTGLELGAAVSLTDGLALGSAASTGVRHQARSSCIMVVPPDRGPLVPRVPLRRQSAPDRQR